MRLNQALISYAVQFLSERGHTMVQTPFTMSKSIMGKVAQLADFDEQLYKVSGAGEDQYLIATSEQPLCGYHLDEWIDPKTLPHKYASLLSPATGPLLASPCPPSRTLTRRPHPCGQRLARRS